MTAFTRDQVRRYSRHVLLPDVGGTGQARLLGASAVVDGSGAAGRIAALFLVAAGVGTVFVDGALDAPVLEARFPLGPGDTGRRLADALAGALAGLNPDVRVVIGPAPAGTPRVPLDAITDSDVLGLAQAFAHGGAAASAFVHRLATGGRP